ncbi:hypothetical protein DPMN_051333 [Dreissena polymorpha]|uniref:EGF-like domain-containing protein n=1 Tax=Dreissena polymorpha TaxID=45954 RepID=A0A9D4CIX6_DREPO|nr:hypothetical protein DPMN_051333 [Dreissena polymorpha]
MRWECFYVALVVGIHFAVSENCYTKQCLNGATCQLHVGFVTCVCSVGYTGSRCETEILECSSNPCKNGATCSER